ncbi:MAG: hypothetical protein PHY92_01525 [Alphaproteobacteria bacterium]|nr:hypothetical protein [Alphaproteobacteria bacterium]
MAGNAEFWRIFVLFCALAVLQGCAGTPKQVVVGPPVPDRRDCAPYGVVDTSPHAKELKEFVAYYKDDVLQAFRKIHARPAKERDRYLVLSVGEQSYVQCILHEHDTEMLCEAASGQFGSKPNILSPRTVETIEQEGFSKGDGMENFKRELNIRKPEDYCHVADLMLETLFKAYDARQGQLKMSAAFVFETGRIPHDYRDTKR